MVRWIPNNERSTAVGIITAGNQVALVVVSPITALFCKNTFLGGWPAIFYFCGAFGVALSATVWFFLSNVPVDNKIISTKEKDFLMVNIGNTPDKNVKFVPTNHFATRPNQNLFHPFIY